MVVFNLDLLILLDPLSGLSQVLFHLALQKNNRLVPSGWGGDNLEILSDPLSGLSQVPLPPSSAKELPIRASLAKVGWKALRWLS